MFMFCYNGVAFINKCSYLLGIFLQKLLLYYNRCSFHFYLNSNLSKAYVGLLPTKQFLFAEFAAASLNSSASCSAPWAAISLLYLLLKAEKSLLQNTLQNKNNIKKNIFHNSFYFCFCCCFLYGEVGWR